MLFCDGQFSFQPRTQIVNRYGHWAIFVFSTYNYTGSSLYFVALYTLFHLYNVFKGCLKDMNSFKLTFFCVLMLMFFLQEMSIS